MITSEEVRSQLEGRRAQLADSRTKLEAQLVATTARLAEVERTLSLLAPEPTTAAALKGGTPA